MRHSHCDMFEFGPHHGPFHHGHGKHHGHHGHHHGPHHGPYPGPHHGPYPGPSHGPHHGHHHGPHHGPHHGLHHGPHDRPHHGPHRGPHHGPHRGPDHGPHDHHRGLHMPRPFNVRFFGHFGPFGQRCCNRAPYERPNDRSSPCRFGKQTKDRPCCCRDKDQNEPTDSTFEKRFDKGPRCYSV